jgi:hypothetical protein
MVDNSSNNSTKGLIIVSKLYQEGKIDDDQRDQLKGIPPLPNPPP